LRLGPSPAPTLHGFSLPPPLLRYVFKGGILTYGSAFYRVLHSTCLAPLLSDGGAFLGFLSSSAPLSLPATPQGSNPESSATSTVPPRLRGHPSGLLVPGLFHPGSTPEVHSSGVSLRTAARILPYPSYPLAVITVATAVPRSVLQTLARSLNRLQGFALRSNPFPRQFPLGS